MLTASPSPRTIPLSPSDTSDIFKSNNRYERRSKSARITSPIASTYSTHVYPTHQCDARKSSQCTSKEQSSSNPTALSNTTPIARNRPNMVDAATQYSPPSSFKSPTTSVKTSASHIARLHLTDSSQVQPQPCTTVRPISSNDISRTSDATMLSVPPGASQSTIENHHKEQDYTISQHGKRQHSVVDIANVKAQPANQLQQHQENVTDTNAEGPSKKVKAEMPSNRIMPIEYEFCDTRDLVVLISSMLMELIRYNDAIPLRDGHLTRFHSRAPPGISVIDYLQRLTTHATLSPPILLSMVYYIDKLCALYPAFTISSLTVHRFLITSATVASKGLSDSFWTNKTYARVGGVSVKELALLELEFLVRVQWRIVPKPEVLVDYYRSLVERSPGYELASPT